MTNPNASPLDEVLCRTPGCRRQSEQRGVCWACWHTVNLMVLNEETTPDELVELGVVLPLDAESGVFRAAFEQAKRNKDGEGAA